LAWFFSLMVFCFSFSFFNELSNILTNCLLINRAFALPKLKISSLFWFCFSCCSWMAFCFSCSSLIYSSYILTNAWFFGFFLGSDLILLFFFFNFFSTNCLQFKKFQLIIGHRKFDWFSYLFWTWFRDDRFWRRMYGVSNICVSR
jgi:hypothetical protein